MRLVRFAVELWMKLAGNKERVIGQFYDFYKLAVGCEPTEEKVSLLKPVPVRVVKLVTMAVAFFDDESAVEPGRFGPDHQLAGLCPQPHGPTLFRDLGLFIEH